MQEWKPEELDLRDDEVGKLLPEHFPCQWEYVSEHSLLLPWGLMSYAFLSQLPCPSKMGVGRRRD
jgi:hypothetical protein